MEEEERNPGDYIEPVHFIIFIIMIFTLAIISYAFSHFVENEITPDFVNTKFKPERPLVIVFGATSQKAESLLEKLSEKDCNVVCASRRHSKWFQMTERNDKIKRSSFIWVHCDNRLHRDIERVFQVSEKWSKKAPIDLVVNMAVINANNDLLKCPFQTQRNGDDVVLRVTGAYNKDYEYCGKLHRKGGMGNEHGFITNVIGTLNLVRLSKEAGAKKIIIPKNNLISEEWFKEKDDCIEFIDIMGDEAVIEKMGNCCG